MILDKRTSEDRAGFVSIELNILLACIIFLLAALVGGVVGGFGAEAFWPGFRGAILSGWRLTFLILAAVGLGLLYLPALLEAFAGLFRRGGAGG